MEKKRINIRIIIIVTLIIIFIIGFILWIVSNIRKQENANIILNYLKNKYGSDAEFEIKTINSEDREIRGDLVINGNGHAMETDKTPEVISSDKLVVANVLSKENNITFTVSFIIDKVLGEKNSFQDDLEDLLVKEDIPKIVSRVTNESLKIDENIIEVDLKEPTVKTQKYKTIPDKDEIIIQFYSMYVDYREINIKNKFNNSDDVFNFAKQYFVELIKILKNNNIECANIDIAFNETNSSKDFYTIILDVEKKEASVYSNITKETSSYVFDETR